MSRKRLLGVSLTLLVLLVAVMTGCDTIQQPEERVRTELVTVVLVVTATPDPNATPAVQIVTATPDRTQVNVPDDIVPDDEDAGSDTTTADGTPLSVNAQGTNDDGLPGNCIRHIIDDGDTIFGLAEEYGVNGFVMLEVNNLSEEDAANLRIGDELIVPLEGCPIEQFVGTPAPEDTPTPLPTQLTVEATEEPEISPTPSVTPTITLPPTATESEIEIVGIIRAGDVTSEGVRIRNNGRIVDLNGWTLSDAEGNEYDFIDRLIFSNSDLTLYTRTGEQTPIASFWGLDEAVWQPGDVVTLRDADGDVQASYRVPSEGSDVP